MCPSRGVWAGRGCRTRPLCPCALLGWLQEHPFPSPCRAGMEPWTRLRAGALQPHRVTPAEAALASHLSCLRAWMHFPAKPQIPSNLCHRFLQDMQRLVPPPHPCLDICRTQSSRSYSRHPQRVLGFSWWSRARLGGDNPAGEAGSSSGWVGQCVGARGESSPCSSQVAPRGVEPPLP